mgnify:CR=1 FL=1
MLQYEQFKVTLFKLNQNINHILKAINIFNQQIKSSFLIIEVNYFSNPCNTE